MSSINLYKGNAAGKSLTMTRKNRGPSFVPCGTPALIGYHEDLSFLASLAADNSIESWHTSSVCTL